MFKLTRFFLFVAGVLGSLAITGTSNATVIIDQGGGNFVGDSNVIFNACDAPNLGPALTVSGCLNSDHDYVVNFFGTENLQVNGGQALVFDEGEDGFDFLKVTTDVGGFATFIVNIGGTSDGQNGSPNNGQVEITPYIDGIARAVQTFDFGENGSNFFRLYIDEPGAVFSALEFQVINFDTTNIQFKNFKQNRLGPSLQPNPGASIPEPATFALFGLGLAGFGVLTRRRRKQAAAT